MDIKILKKKIIKKINMIQADNKYNKCNNELEFSEEPQDVGNLLFLFILLLLIKCEFLDFVYFEYWNNKFVFQY